MSGAANRLGSASPGADPLRHLEEALADLERRGLLRAPRGEERWPEGAIVLCSNDYLGYASEPWPEVHVKSGAGASRLVSGDDPAHEEAEAAIAEWLGAEAALLFSSGYAANAGVVSALAGREDVVVSDALNHASLIDGCRLSGAKVLIVPHADAGAVEAALAGSGQARRRWVVTESYFSMDGDSPDLLRLRALCDAHDAALVVDEAHALGVFGPEGRGLCAAAGVRPDVLVGTAGKALGLHGAFVVGSRPLRLWLWNRARSFVFSTAVVPALAKAITARVRRARQDEAGRARVHAAAARVREGLAQLGVAVGGRGPILPWIVGEAGNAVAISRRLREHGVVVQPIRPPTVPEGTARLRVTVNAGLADQEIERALAAFRAA